MTPTDTDNAADIYRYDDVTGELIRVSVDAAGTGGNGDDHAERSPEWRAAGVRRTYEHIPR